MFWIVHIPHELLFFFKKNPPVEALTVNEDGQLSLKFVDSCQPDGFVKTELTSAPPNLEGNSTIGCNCSITDDNYCHITSL